MSSNKKEQAGDNQQANMASVVERNIKALVDRRIEEESKKPIAEKIADKITGFTGNMAFVYTHIVIFGIWITWNKGWLPFQPFDNNFIGLQLVTSIEAIFLTTFVLISQKSLDLQGDKRADLDLQISLLAEHEITRVLGLLSAIADKLEVKEAHNEEINELAEDVMPEKVMDTMEDHKDNLKNGKN